MLHCPNCGEELTPENAKRHSRFHPRCGTSFMFFMILLGIIAGLFIGSYNNMVTKRENVESAFSTEGCSPSVVIMRFDSLRFLA